MTIKDDFDDQFKGVHPEEDDFDELEHSMLKERNFKSFSAIFSKTETPFVIMGIFIVGLIVFFLVFRSNEQTPVNDQQFKSLEAKIVQTEERLNAMESAREKLEQIENQSKIIESFMERFDRMEAAMTLRMDLLEKKIEQQQQDIQKVRLTAKSQSITLAAKTSTKKSSKKPSVKSDPKKSVRYHQVKSGETLYSISRKYGLSVPQLQKLNKSVSGESIYVGQKLAVTP